MNYKRLFIFIEGPDDERFFDKIIKPKFQQKYDYIETIQHAHIKDEKINNFIRSIKSMGADYIHVNDINDSPCITHKKEKIQNRIREIDNKSKITVVIKEIESWYLAGISDEKSKKFTVPTFKSTDDITKEKFNNLIPRKFTSRIDFMIEILKFFSYKIAKEKNKSFKYFFEKFLLEYR